MVYTLFQVAFLPPPLPENVTFACCFSIICLRNLHSITDAVKEEFLPSSPPLPSLICCNGILLWLDSSSTLSKPLMYHHSGQFHATGEGRCKKASEPATGPFRSPSHHPWDTPVGTGLFPGYVQYNRKQYKASIMAAIYVGFMGSFLFSSS